MNSRYYFDDLQIGQKWVSSRRTVTESDVVIFAGMTGDFDRAHVDHDYASNSRFKQPMMHGMMGMAWAAGLSTTAPAVNTLVLVGVEEWKFLRPVHIGDTVCAVTEVMALESAGRSAGKVTWRKSLLNQHDEEVQAGLFISLVELRPRQKIPKMHSFVSSSSAAQAASVTQAAQPAAEEPAAPPTSLDKSEGERAEGLTPAVTAQQASRANSGPAISESNSGRSDHANNGQASAAAADHGHVSAGSSSAGSTS